MYLLWFDDSARKTAAQKLDAACEAYRTRFKRAPTVAKVNARDVTDRPDMLIYVEDYVRPNNFWVGED